MMEVRQADQATLMHDKPCLDRSGNMNGEQVPVLIIKLYFTAGLNLWCEKKTLYNKKMRSVCL